MTEHSQVEKMKTSAFLAKSSLRSLQTNLNDMYRGTKVRLTRGKYKGREATITEISLGWSNEALFFVAIPNLKDPTQILNDHVDSRRGYRAHEIEEVPHG